MKIVRTSYYDDGYLGDTIIRCNCGSEFEIETSVGNVAECPKCGLKGIIRSKVQVWIDLTGVPKE